MMQEGEWIAATLAGDRTAFAQLVDRYQHAVHNLCYRMLGNGEEAADAAQESFLRCYAQLERFDGEHPFASWLFAIASHYCLDLLRRRRHRSVDLELAEATPSADPGPEEKAETNEHGAAIRSLLDRLPPEYRLVVVLRYWYDLACDEIARLNGSSIGAVKTRLHRARALLAQMMENDPGTLMLATQSLPTTERKSNHGDRGNALHGSEKPGVSPVRQDAGDRTEREVAGPSFDLSAVPTLR